MTTILEAIKFEVEQMMKSAYIVSPRFDDYKIVEVLNTGGVTQLDDSIEAIIKNMIENIMEGKDPSTSDSIGSSITKGTDTEKKAIGMASKGVSLLDNPGQLVAMGLRVMPHTAAIAFAAMIAPMVFDYLTKPGGDLDLRLKIYLQDEFNAFLSRQTQKDTEMGVRQVIIQSRTGFTALNGMNNYNTMKGIREGGINTERMDRIGMKSHAKGLF